MSEQVSLDHAQRFLDRHFATKAFDLALIGEGGWSRCFGFQVGSDGLSYSSCSISASGLRFHLAGWAGPL